MAASGARALALNGPGAPTVSQPQTSPSQTTHAQNRTALAALPPAHRQLTIRATQEKQKFLASPARAGPHASGSWYQACGRCGAGELLPSSRTSQARTL